MSALAITPSVSSLLDTGSSRRGSHRVSDWSCRRYFAYREILRLRPRREPEAKAAGTVFHIGSAWRDLILSGEPRAAGVDPIEMMRTAPSRVAFAFELALKLYRAWADAHRNETYRVLSVETEYAGTIGGYLHTQRFDTVASYRGKVIVIDRKTAGGDVKYAHLDYKMDVQMCSAEIFGRNVLSQPPPRGFGLPWGGIMLDVVGKRDPTEFARPWLTITDQSVRDAKMQIAETNAEIEACAAEQRDPWDYRPNRALCRGRYGWCEFLSLCQYGKRALDEYNAVTDVATAVEG